MRPAAFRVAAVAATLALALGGCARTTPTLSAIPSTSVSETPGPFGPGAAGVGDSYYPLAGNGGYDVANYDLDVTYDPGARNLLGKATIAATATGNLTSFDLDFTGLTTNSITVNGQPAQWEQRDNGELVVTPASPLGVGTSFTTVVAYGGRPHVYSGKCLGDSGFLTSTDGAVAIGEPQVAASWFPVNDHPRDKATYTIHISAPSGLAAISNGVLISQQGASRPGYTTSTWRESSPMASYLATMVVGKYRVRTSTHHGLPVVQAVDASLPTSIDDALARTPEVVDYLETVFGPYPFDALGGIVINDPRVGFALENQTRPIYSNDFFRGGDSSWVLAHELAHQWFGDSVSVHDWSEIWLNEGFATYAEWLWTEYLGGPPVQQTFDGYYTGVAPEMWQVPPANLGKDHLFCEPGSEYTRGAMALEALRMTVGDDSFFRILKDWAAREKDSSATTAQFVALAEEISGRQLDTLFQQWLYGTTRPPRP
jgi:aminopeptidase N